MTLNTDVYVLDECDPMEVFRFCQGLLARFDERGVPASAQKWSQEQDKTWRNGASTVEPGNPWSIDNEPMQGLPAWLMLNYRPDAPLRPADAVAACDDEYYCNRPGFEYYDESQPTCTGGDHPVACWLELDFDTAYSYKVNGMGCGDLHAALVALLGEWLTSKGLRWKWRNEFTGDVHDDAASLIELVSGGFEASAWFSTTVMPAIKADVEAKGGKVEWA